MKIENYLNQTEILKTCNYIQNGASTVEIASKIGVSKSTAQKIINYLIYTFRLNDEVYIPYHPSNKQFSQNEIDVLIGGLLGDTWLGYLGQGTHACGSFTHKLEHDEYVKFKYNHLRRLCSKPTIHNKFDKRSNRSYQQSFCKIASNPLLNDIVEKFYKPNKIVDQSYIDLLSPLGIAVWYMDDGGPTSYGYKFAVDCFSEGDVVKLSNLLRRFEIHNVVSADCKRITIGMSHAKKFKQLIEPFVCECMKYKLKVFKKDKNKKYSLVDI